MKRTGTSSRGGSKCLDRYVELAVELGASGGRVIRARDVAVREWVALKCKFGCENYGRSHTCPPNSPTPEQTRRLLAEYERAVLIHHARPAPPARARRLNLSKLVFELERTAFFDGYYKAWGLGCGPCGLCRDCPVEGCRHPRQARPSMEACGIDVFETARAASFPIDVVRCREQASNRFALVLIE